METTRPRTTDAEFFGEQIDTTRPGLEGIPAAIAAGDYAAARRIFAAEARASLQPQRWFRQQRDFRGNPHFLPGETAEAAGDRVLAGTLISCSTPCTFADRVDWFANPTFNQYKEWTWQLSRHQEWPVLGERYRATRDERYATAFVKFFLSWKEQTAVEPLDAPSNATWAWRTIEAGIRMGGSWQWALHSFYRSPHFTDDVLVEWYKSVWEHGWRLRNIHHSHNWLIMEQNGLGQIGILYPQFRQASEWRDFAFATLIHELGVQNYPDGMQYELSTGYHQVNVRNYQWLWDVAEAYDVPVPPAFRDGLEQMHAANIKLMMPDGRLPDLNDGGWHPVAGLLERAAALYPAREDFRWAASWGQEGAPPSYTSIALDYSGLYVMRSDWGDDAVWALLDGGPFGFAHQHEDKLNLIVHAYGRRLITEAGNYAYDDSEMRRYVLSTRGHNTARVDGQDQNRRRNYNRANERIERPSGAVWHSDEAQDTVEAVYNEGYGPEADRTVTHRRRVTFFKQGTAGFGPCFRVEDTFTPADSGEHSYEILWHLHTGAPLVEGLSVRSVDPGVANVALIPEDAPVGLSVEIVAGQEQPEWQGWHAVKNHQQGEYEACPTAIYRVRAVGEVKVTTWVVPTRGDEAKDIRPGPPSHR